MTDGRRPPHPANTLNELPGEEWLYFTKSLLTTAYPSELGHAARRAHGANKPPRLMSRTPCATAASPPAPNGTSAVVPRASQRSSASP